MNKNLLNLVWALFKKAEEFLTITESKKILINSLHRARNEVLFEGLPSAKIIKKINQGLGKILLNLIEFVQNDNNYPGISVKNPGKITIYNNPKDEDRWRVDTDTRQFTTLGRYIKRKFLPNTDKIIKYRDGYYNVSEILSDDVIDLFVKEFDAIVAAYLGLLDKDISGISGSDVVDTYEKFQGDTGSCMTGEGCYKMQLLANNPDKVSLLNLNNEARALLWTADDGTRILDRVYPAGTKYTIRFKKWAKKNGYVWRDDLEGAPDDSKSVPLSDGSNPIITLNAKGVRDFPYLDTFRYGFFDGDDLVLSNYIDLGSLSFKNDDGSYAKGEECVHCGNSYDEDSMEYIDSAGYLCEDCLDSYYSKCDDCYNYFMDEDLISPSNTSRMFCEDCLDSNTFVCENCNERITNNDRSYALGDDYCLECVEDMEQCVNCDKPLPNGGVDKDGETYCDDCFEDIEEND